MVRSSRWSLSERQMSRARTSGPAARLKGIPASRWTLANTGVGRLSATSPGLRAPPQDSPWQPSSARLPYSACAKYLLCGCRIWLNCNALTFLWGFDMSAEG
jgi:hypothetical protein